MILMLISHSMAQMFGLLLVSHSDILKWGFTYYWFTIIYFWLLFALYTRSLAWLEADYGEIPQPSAVSTYMIIKYLCLCASIFYLPILEIHLRTVYKQIFSCRWATTTLSQTMVTPNCTNYALLCFASYTLYFGLKFTPFLVILWLIDTWLYTIIIYFVFCFVYREVARKI